VSLPADKPPRSPFAGPPPRSLRWWLKIAWGALVPMAVTLWLQLPASRPVPQTVQGLARPSVACLGLCAPVLEVGGLKLSCKADLLGVPYACREKLYVHGEVTATYATLPSASRLVGQQQIDGVLVRLEHDGQILYKRSVSGQVWRMFYGGWVFHAVWWPLVLLLTWGRPLWRALKTRLAHGPVAVDQNRSS
jgi:hypothetical protein